MSVIDIKPFAEKRILYANTDEPLEIVFTEDKIKDIHKYEIITPGKYQGKKGGVTAVTGFKDKSGPLMSWAVNMAIECMQAGGSYADAKAAHRKKKEKAGDIGTRVHFWIEQYLSGNELKYDPDMAESVEGFLRWFKTSNLETLHSERTVYSKRLDYAGRVDWVGMKDGKYGIIDWKTGKCDNQYSSYRKQFTGKLRAKTDNIIQDGGYDVAIAEEDGRKAEFHGVLYIPVTGKVEYFESTETEIARQAFEETLMAKRRWSQLEATNKYREPTKS
jgi:hypothetical protein